MTTIAPTPTAPTTATRSVRADLRVVPEFGLPELGLPEFGLPELGLPETGLAGTGAGTATTGPKVLYVLKRFPRLSETFVLHEVLELERAGVQVLVDGLLEPELGPTHQEFDSLQAAVRYLPGRPQWRSTSVWPAHLRVARRHPVRWTRLALDSRRRGLSRRFRQAGMVADRIQRERVDHVHAHFATAASEVATLAAVLTGVPCSVTAHAKDIHHRDNRAVLATRLAPCHAVVTVSQANVDHLRSVLRPGTPVQLVRNGVQVGAPADPGSSDVVLCIARLVPKKGIDVLLHAAAQLRATYPALRVEIIGSGPLAGELQALRDQLGLADVVELRGAVTSDEVAASIARARVVALPCRIDADGDRDGMPTVLVEALARAVPVVATDVPGLAELVQHRRTGLLVAPDDPTALAGALAELLGDADLARRLGRNGRDLVARGYNPDGATRRLLDIFAVDQHTRGAR